ncbi:uncharacterized protein LOC143558723 [Bidens hawaiensis]|uniref:uncharacterized protein LOC143558723 n=1 Tax=Bidens hawaiensis TaxID=980011 RepID=UPI00404AFD85
MEVDDGVTNFKCFKNCNNYISKYPINNDVDTSGMPTEPIVEANVGDIQLTQFDTQTQLTQTDVEVAAHRLYELIQDFENNISDIKINLEEAKIKYPYSEAIKEVEELWKYVVGNYFLGENNKPVGGDHVNDLENSPNYLTPRTIEELGRHVKAYTDSKYTTPLKQALVFSRPKFDIGSSSNVPKFVSVGEIIVTDYVMAGDHVEGKEDNKVEEKQEICPQTFGEDTCSPYVQRVVQLKEPVTKPENLVSDMIYAAYGGTW